MGGDADVDEDESGEVQVSMPEASKQREVKEVYDFYGWCCSL